MLTLLLDFGSADHLMALVSESNVQCLKRLENQTDDSLLMPALKQLLRDAGASLKDLTHIAAVTGPGGFMSLRVGISLANALGWSLKVPVAGVHLSDMWNSRANSQLPIAKSLLWCHSTKRHLLFVRGYGDLEKLWSEPIAISIEEAQRQIPAGTSYVGELIEEHRKALPQLKPLEQTKPIEEVLPGFIQSLNFEMKPLEPWYGRGY